MAQGYSAAADVDLTEIDKSADGWAALKQTNLFRLKVDSRRFGGYGAMVFDYGFRRMNGKALMEFARWTCVNGALPLQAQEGGLERLARWSMIKCFNPGGFSFRKIGGQIIHRLRNAAAGWVPFSSGPRWTRESGTRISNAYFVGVCSSEIRTSSIIRWCFWSWTISAGIGLVQDVCKSKDDTKAFRDVFVIDASLPADSAEAAYYSNRNHQQ